MLVKLPLGTVRLLSSTEIITSVSSAVKELIENSLDAGATNVDVKLINNGLDQLEVKDNGSGINQADTVYMAQPNFTSKISDFSDLESLQSYGFRGEALNALCRVGQVTVRTATTSDAVATVYTLDNGGNIVSSKPFHLVQGTTVTVSNIFKNLPVRRQVLGSGRRALEELKLVEATVKSLAVIRPDVRVTLTHNKCLVWQKNSCSSLQNSFAQLVGYSVSQQMEEVTLKCNSQVIIDMLIPKKECNITAVCKSSPTGWCLLFVNQRPVTYKKIMKVLRQQLSSCFGDAFSSKKHAACLISITADPSRLDVNLEPNKTKVVLSEEDVVIALLEKKLKEYYNSPLPAAPSTDTMLPVSDELSAESIPHIEEEPSEVERATKRRKVDATNASHAHQNSISVFCSGDKIDLNGSSFKVEACVRNTGEPFAKNLNIEQRCVTQGNQSNLQAQPIPQLWDGESNSTNETCLRDADPSKHCEGKEPMKTLDNNAEDWYMSSKELARDLSNGENQTNEFSHSKDRCLLPAGTGNMNSESNFLNKSSSLTDRPLNGSKETEDDHSLEENDEHMSVGAIDTPTDLWADLNMDEVETLDVFASQSETSIITSTQCGQEAKDLEHGLKRPENVSLETWSMGHLQGKSGGLIQGSCVFMQGSHSSVAQVEASHNACDQEPFREDEKILHRAASPPSSSLSHVEMVAQRDNDGRTSPIKSPKNHSLGSGLKKSPKSTKSSTMEGMDSSLQSVSSQMGRKELAAFTKFARDARPQLILDNPGIAFTRVASILAGKWQNLSAEERDHYEELAKQSASTRRLWQTGSNQQKLSWGKNVSLDTKKRDCSENVKSKSSKPGKQSCYQSERPTRKEQTNDLNIGKLLKKIEDTKQSRQTSSTAKRIILVGQLQPSGSWVCLDGKSQIHLLSHFRLQEVVVNHRLLETYQLPITPLSAPQTISPQILGEVAWSVLLSLPRGVDDLSPATVVSADVITKNGFRIEIYGGGHSAAITHVAETINFYGMRELKEVLDLYSNQESPTVSQCRPLRVINHIKGETVRICRKSPSMMEKAMVEELLEYWETLIPRRDSQCLHFKPLFTEIFNIPPRLGSRQSVSPLQTSFYKSLLHSTKIAISMTDAVNM